MEAKAKHVRNVEVLDKLYFRGVASKWQQLAQAAMEKEIIFHLEWFALFSDSKKCGPCHGKGLVREKKTVEVDIPAGIDDGMRVRLARQGDAPVEGAGVNGDLLIEVHVGRHPVFTRDGSNVLLDVNVPLTTAILGGTVSIPTIDGEVDLTIPAGTQPGDRKTLRRRGMAKLGKSEKGDMNVTVKVEVPKKLSERQKKLLVEAFGTAEEKASKKNDEKISNEKVEGKEDKGFFGHLFDKK